MKKIIDHFTQLKQNIIGHTPSVTATPRNHHKSSSSFDRLRSHCIFRSLEVSSTRHALSMTILDDYSHNKHDLTIQHSTLMKARNKTNFC